MTLEQLMAFTVTGDHGRQEQVWEALARSPYKEAYQIRRMLNEGAVRSPDKRGQFVGLQIYDQAGGVVMRNLFQLDAGGWLQDPVLLDRRVVEGLQRDTEAIAAEGWSWSKARPTSPTATPRGCAGSVPRSCSPTKQATYDALQTVYGALEETYADAGDCPKASTSD